METHPLILLLSGVIFILFLIIGCLITKEMIQKYILKKSVGFWSVAIKCVLGAILCLLNFVYWIFSGFHASGILMAIGFFIFTFIWRMQAKNLRN